MKSTIRFKATLARNQITLPKSAYTKLPSKSTVTVEGIINTFPFRASIEAKNGNHELKMSAPLQDAAGAKDGDVVIVEITRVDDESEIRLPVELSKALANAPKARDMWADITPMSRREWILWITTSKQEETRMIRVKKACSMLSSGKRRVCCFAGINWLTKDHPTVSTWGKLTKRS